MTDYTPPILTLPGGAQSLLLHSCCAPCSSAVLEAILASGIEFTLFFYNPNIHPQKEYLLRKDENMRFAGQHGIPIVDGDYDAENWFERTKGFEHEPEGGARCTLCFDMRFERTARYAWEHGFSVISSVIGISLQRDIQQANDCGHRAAAAYPGMTYWDHNWRKQGGVARMQEISHQEKFYRQQYCGCIYSMLDTNRQRKEQGSPLIEIGQYYYGDETPSQP